LASAILSAPCLISPTPHPFANQKPMLACLYRRSLPKSPNFIFCTYIHLSGTIILPRTLATILWSCGCASTTSSGTPGLDVSHELFGWRPHPYIVELCASPGEIIPALDLCSGLSLATLQHIICSNFALHRLTLTFGTHASTSEDEELKEVAPRSSRPWPLPSASGMFSLLESYSPPDYLRTLGS
jgi:hypothetical protein